MSVPDVDRALNEANRHSGCEPVDPRLVLLTCSTFDLGINLLVYDRKNDDELPVKDVDDLIKEKKVDIDFLVEVFRRGLIDTGAFSE